MTPEQVLAEARAIVRAAEWAHLWRCYRVTDATLRRDKALFMDRCAAAARYMDDAAYDRYMKACSAAYELLWTAEEHP